MPRTARRWSSGFVPRSASGPITGTNTHSCSAKTYELGFRVSAGRLAVAAQVDVSPEFDAASAGRAAGVAAVPMPLPMVYRRAVGQVRRCHLPPPPSGVRPCRATLTASSPSSGTGTGQAQGRLRAGPEA